MASATEAVVLPESFGISEMWFEVWIIDVEGRIVSGDKVICNSGSLDHGLSLT